MVLATVIFSHFLIEIRYKDFMFQDRFLLSPRVCLPRTKWWCRLGDIGGCNGSDRFVDGDGISGRQPLVVNLKIEARKVVRLSKKNGELCWWWTDGTGVTMKHDNLVAQAHYKPDQPSQLKFPYSASNHPATTYSYSNGEASFGKVRRGKGHQFLVADTRL